MEFNEDKKSYHQVKISRVIDMYELCDNNLKEKLEQGRYERDQMFYPYQMDDRFPTFVNTIESNHLLI